MQVLPGLVVAADAHSIVAHQKVQLEDKFEDLVQRDLQPVVTGPSKEALLEDCVQIGVVQRNELFEVCDLRQLRLEQFPLALDDGDHYVLVHGSKEVLHLLPEELQLSQLSEVIG